jgi:O-antigen ligase
MENKKLFRVIEIIWYFLIFLLPFTSLPLASKLLRSEMVAAPSIVLLLILSILVFIYFPRNSLFKNKIFLPLFIFGLFALLSSLLSFFLPIPIQKNFLIEKNIIEGLITLAIGILFFFVTITLLRNEVIKSKTLKVIVVSFIPLSIWCLFQFVFGQIIHDYPDWMVAFQKMFTTSGVLYKDRLTGFAYEPSWLAHQMNMFYIPIWISSSFTRKSSFRKLAGKLIIEDLLLLLAIFYLILSKSRVGLITFIFVVFYLMFRFNNIFIKKISTLPSIANKKILIRLLPIIFLIIFLIFIFLSLFFFSQFDTRMENLFNIDFYKNRNLFSIANEFVFAERILYWQTGWQIFNDYPIFGVGLGNSGFFFEEYLPSFAWALDEPRHLIFQANYQGNIKNLWFRLLAETGMIGFLGFLTWLILIYVVSYQFDRSKKAFHSFWGLVGKIALISLIFEGFSIDSFALPYYWILFGFVASNYKDLENSTEG